MKKTPDIAQLDLTGQATLPEQVIKLRQLASDLRDSYQTTVEKYYSLCMHIRHAQISPEVLTSELFELGFTKSGVSEIKRVAFSTQEIFDEYKEKTIGFKLALDKARDTKRKAKTPKTPPEKALFENAIREAFEKFVPVAGKLPKWFPLKLEAQACNITITVKRK